MARPAPNIVLILVDNQPAGMLGCAGNQEIHTPHLDGLAARAVRFSEAFCANAMCSPCRASVLTSLMPSQHGVHTWLDDGEVGNWPPGQSHSADREASGERGWPTGRRRFDRHHGYLCNDTGLRGIAVAVVRQEFRSKRAAAD